MKVVQLPTTVELDESDMKKAIHHWLKERYRMIVNVDTITFGGDGIARMSLVPEASIAARGDDELT